MPVAGGYAGILAGQFHWWQEPQSTDTSNPIPFWEATFTAPQVGGTSAVHLSAFTGRFDVYPHETTSSSESRLDGLTEGAGTITVIPAPASAIVFVGVAAWRGRR